MVMNDVVIITCYFICERIYFIRKLFYAELQSFSVKLHEYVPKVKGTLNQICQWLINGVSSVVRIHHSENSSESNQSSSQAILTGKWEKKTHPIIGRTSKQAPRAGYEPRPFALSGDGSCTEHQLSCLSSNLFQKMAFVIAYPMTFHDFHVMSWERPIHYREPFMGMLCFS